jgi:Pretoxin HINT domain
MVEGCGWVDARHLQPGDILITKDGSPTRIEAIQPIEIRAGPVAVYNFEVDTNHSYYVSSRGYLVHNKRRCPPKTIEVSGSKYPESYGHAVDSGNPNGPFTVDRPGSGGRRNNNIAGTETIPGHDRDEWPPAVFEEGAGADVIHIPSSDNRGAGATIGNGIRDIPDGGQVIIIWTL